MLCNCNETFPKSADFVRGLTDMERCIVIVCGVLCLIAVAVLVDNLVFIWRQYSRLRMAVISSTWLVAMCPTHAVIALVAMLVPNAFLFRDVTICMSQSIVMYKFVQLLSTYANSFTGMKEQILTRRIHFNVRPLCCCFSCFPTVGTSRSSICMLKVLVLQYPVFIVILSHVIMITWLDGEYIPGSWTSSNLYSYLSALRLLSVLIATYSLNILVALCKKTMRCLYVQHKFLALSLCLLFFGIQGILFEFMAEKGVFNFQGCFSSEIMANFYENGAFCLEMFLLTLFNLWSYRRPLGPAFTMSELEKPSLNIEINDLNLETITTNTQTSVPKEIDYGKLADPTNPKENNTDIDIRSSAIVKISSSVSVMGEDNSVAKWQPTITRSWNVNMDGGLIQIHNPNNGRSETTVQNCIECKFSEVANRRGVNSLAASLHRFDGQI